MQRRTVLKLLGGMAAVGVRASAFQPTPSRRPNRIVIAGAGILGANIAYQLARRGASVTVLERQKPATGATANSFAWINAKKQPLSYFTLNNLGIQAWRELQADIKDLPVLWGGSLEWTSDAEHAATEAKTLRQYQAWGYPIHAIDEPRLRALERNVQPGAVASAVHAESEGNADPVHATEVILARAIAAGVDVRYPVEVVGVETSGGRLHAVKTSGGEIPADVLVIACGVDTPKVAAMAGLTVQLTRSPGILVHTAPVARAIDRIVLSPLGQIKQKPDGRIVTGMDFGPAKVEDTTRAYGEQFLRRMSAILPALRESPLEQVTLGLRPMPKDGHPIIGFAEGRPDVYVTVMHSGITLGPLVGRLVATEILDDVRVDLLAPYRLERFKS